MDKNVYPYKPPHWTGIIFLFACGVVYSMPDPPISTTIDVVRFWFTVFCYISFIGNGVLYLNASFDKNRLITLSVRTLTAPKSLMNKKTITIPLTSIINLRVRKRGRMRKLVVRYAGKKNVFESKWFQNDADFDDLCATLSERLKMEIS